MSHILFLLVGASGAGKTTFGEVLSSFGVNELISHTTRPKRPGEKQGVHYHFCTDEQFSQVQMVESSSYPSSGGVFHYGTSANEIDNKLKSSHAFAVVDRSGAEKLKKKYPSRARVIFMPISEGNLASRLRSRGDTEETIQLRIEHARKNNEYENFSLADYCIQPKDVAEMSTIAKQLLFTECLLDMTLS